MWKHTSLKLDIDKTLMHKLQKYTKIGGVLFIILGAVGIFFPTFRLNI